MIFSSTPAALAAFFSSFFFCVSVKVPGHAATSQALIRTLSRMLHSTPLFGWQ